VACAVCSCCLNKQIVVDTVAGSSWPSCGVRKRNWRKRSWSSINRRPRKGTISSRYKWTPLKTKWCRYLWYLFCFIYFIIRYIYFYIEIHFFLIERNVCQLLRADYTCSCDIEHIQSESSFCKHTEVIWLIVAETEDLVLRWCEGRAMQCIGWVIFRPICHLQL